MAEIVLGRFRPAPGTPIESFEIPGAGLYEADFEVPGWLVPDFDTDREFEFFRDGKTVRHLRTAVHGNILTVRFTVTDNETGITGSTVAAAPVLTIAVVARAIFGVVLGSLAVLVIKGIVDGLREIRKLGESKAGVGLGIGVAAAGIALLLISKGR